MKKVFRLVAGYQVEGVSSRESMIISREERDQHLLISNGDTFIGTDSLNAWIYFTH